MLLFKGINQIPSNALLWPTLLQGGRKTTVPLDQMIISGSDSRWQYEGQSRAKKGRRAL